MKSGSLLAMAAMMGSVYDYPFSNSKEKSSLRPQDIDVTIKKILPKGCKVYTIEGVEIVAINQQSALKKYNKYHKK